MEAGYLVIGMGRFGKSVAATLYNNGKTVLAIDSNEEIVQQIIDDGIVSEAVTVDSTDENSLVRIINDDFDTAFVCIGSDAEASIMTTLILKEAGMKNIICKARTEKQGKVLMKIGADLVVYPEKEMAEKLVMKVIKPNMTEYFKLSKGYSIIEFSSPKKFIGKRLDQLDLRNKYEINIIGIKNGEEFREMSPKAETVIETGDALLVMANDSKVRKICNEE